MDKNYGYKHTKGFLVFIIVTLLMITVAYSQTPDSYTGNLVNGTNTANTVTSTWQNVGLINGGLPCWAPDDVNKGAYCGPLAYSNNNSLNFSYGLANVHQYVNISKALPNSGTGLITTGFVFSWMSKNGNNWEPTTNLDTLSAYVQLYDKGNKLVENFYWDLNYIHNWTNFSYNKNWSKPYRANEVTNAKFGFIGMDSSYWAGPYGPEITNINFSLKYKPDPCVKNPLYSPDCPNFSKELAERTATPTTNTTTLTNTSIDTNSVNIDTFHNKPNDNKFSDSKEKIYEEGVYEEGSLVPDKLIDTLIKIADNKEKEDKITMDAVNTAIVETDKISQQTVRQAEQISNRAVRQSIETRFENTNTTENTNKETKAQQALSMFANPTVATASFLVTNNFQQQFNILQTPQTLSNNTAINEVRETKPIQSTLNVITNPITVESNITTFALFQNNSQQNVGSTLSLINPQISLMNPLLGQSVDTPTLQSSFLTNKADPINNILESKINVDEKKEEVKTTQVKQNVQDNELANGMPITQLAVAPIGFNQYTNFVLKDTIFYAPKEIYRNQRTIDNNRALRQLASDRLHQELVDQQYRR